MSSSVDFPHLPRLSARHSAMLAEMGVPLWWASPGTAVSAPASAPVPAAASQPPAAPGMPARVTPPSPQHAPRGNAAAAADTHNPAVPVRPAAPVPVALAPAEFGHLNQADLEAAIRACQRCNLGQRRQQAVPGMGDLAPDWLIVGEAPGEEEDRQGLPFVGRAGQLLDRMLAAMGLTREQKVYIANVIKCRPPQNRNPEPTEIAQCTPYLLRQVDLLQPRLILAMGRFAAQTVLAEGGRFSADALRQMPLGKLRGQVHEVTLAGRVLPVVVTYHPAYLLRSPAEKAKAWADLCLAMETMDRLPPR